MGREVKIMQTTTKTKSTKTKENRARQEAWKSVSGREKIPQIENDLLQWSIYNGIVFATVFIVLHVTFVQNVSMQYSFEGISAHGSLFIFLYLVWF